MSVTKFSGEVGKPLRGGGYSSRSGRDKKVQTNSLPARAPGIGGTSVGKYLGNLKGRRTIKGGGSVSGKRWNNNGQPVDVNTAGSGTIRASKFQGNYKRGELTPGFSPQGADFTGNIKTKRPKKGGGSISGRLWNNNGQPVDVNTAGSGTIRASKFQGNIKGGKPAKGGGSISGKLWNNNGQPIDVNGAGRGTIRASKFQGNIKTGKPEKGGGSISGKLWNNNEQPIDVNGAGKGTIRASKFQGNIKTSKPEKGGGSISGKLWNNNEQPIDVIEAGKGTVNASKFQGRSKSGNLFKRAYVQNPNSSKESIKKLRPDETTYKVDGLQIKVKQRDYKDKPVAAKGSLPGISPKKSTVKASEYARGVKVYWNYKHNKNSADLALDGRAPTRAAERAGEFSGRTKQTKEYRHNPNSADDALKVFYPAKAIARLDDYQGNVKMRKFNNKNLHPDAKFAHGFRDNVKEERTFLMNVKLFWAKLFKKSDTQPDHLKEKIRKPRYDKGELGMCND